jgi:DNA-binding transcriptional ArsR family regulator
MVTSQQKQHETVFRAVADPTRRQILDLLRSSEFTVGEIAGHFRISRPAISRHIRILQSARLVVTHPDGAANVCRLNAKPLRALNDWVRDYETFWADSLRDLKRHVEGKR